MTILIRRRPEPSEFGRASTAVTIVPTLTVPSFSDLLPNSARYGASFTTLNSSPMVMEGGSPDPLASAAPPSAASASASCSFIFARWSFL